MRDALARTLLDLVAVPSPTGDERALCDHVQERLTASLGAAVIERHEHSLVVRVAERPGKPRIALAGHLDTVSTEHEAPPRIDGNLLYGPGASDMKSGLAVMIELAERLDREALGCDLTLVFYEREEGPCDENMLAPLIERYPHLKALDLAICLEPSDNGMQLGCMGSVHAAVRFRGKTAHSARPWQGVNAILQSAPVLGDLAAQRPKDVTLDGLLYREVLSPTMASGGRSRNIIPDAFELNVNYRFAPGRTPEEALQDIERLVDGRAEVHAVDLSPAARPHKGHPLVQKLAASGVTDIKSKQAWTDVATFDAVEVPAVNFGPGNQDQAHQKNEHTELDKIEVGYGILERFLREL